MTLGDLTEQEIFVLRYVSVVLPYARISRAFWGDCIDSLVNKGFVRMLGVVDDAIDIDPQSTPALGQNPNLIVVVCLADDPQVDAVLQEIKTWESLTN